MTKTEAHKIALAILSLEDIGAIVAEQCDVVGLNRDESKMVVAAAHEIGDDMHKNAGKEALARVLARVVEP